jgi:molybdopterin-synthase adenylyltransferase
MIESMVPQSHELSQEEIAIYEWQMWVPGFGREGQEKLKQAAVLVSRVGGIGGVVAYQLAAAGVGKLILAHGGNLQPSDLNRQLLQTHAHVGKPRIDSIRSRLLDLNPRLEIVTVDSNINENNVTDLVSQADVIVDCAPMFEERFAMNRAAIAQRKPLIECAMYELEAQLTTIIPGKSPCLRCVFPETPSTWKRQFPVFGAVSGSVGCLGAMEAIKLISGLGKPLIGHLLRYDLRDMSFQTFAIERRPDCKECAELKN